MSANVYLPKILKIGSGTSQLLPQTLQELGLMHPLIVTDPFMKASGNLEKLVAPLNDNSINFGVFSECVADPTTESVNQGLAVWLDGNFDCVVALGGGSSMDTAKAISVLARQGGHMRDFKAPSPIPEAFPIIAIPTTAGTGSEATRVTVITDTETQEKMMCLGIGLLPCAALIDYSLTLSMPRRLTADTGLDTLCHAMEAFVSRKSNAFTDGIALSCLSAVAQHLETACSEPENDTAREAMMLAATQGGIAFSNASVTLIHGMSRPVGAFFHIPHGMSNAMLMPIVSEYSIPGAQSRYAQCARAMQFATQGDSDQQACTKLLDNLYEFCQRLDVPSPETYGIEKGLYFDNLTTMAEQALASGSPNNNPVIPTADDIVALYEKAWSHV